MLPSRPLSGLFCALVVLAAPLGAHAAGLDAARKAYADLNYEVCQEEARASLGGPADRTERVDAYRLLGLCQAALGDTEEARDAFTKMLLLDPAAELPKGLSPRFTSSYLEAKGELLDREPLALVIEEERLEGRTRIVRLQVKGADELVDRIAWEDDEGERSSAFKAAERMELELPAEVATKLVGLDDAGGVVVELSLAGPALAHEAEPGGAAVGSAPGDGPGSVVTDEDAGADTWLWVGVAAGAGVLLAGGAAVVAGFMLSPPSRVTLESRVLFP